MTRTLAIATAAAALTLPALAFAAGFGSTSETLGAGTVAVPGCDTSFTVAYATAGGDVTTVTVGDIADPACEGGELSLTLVDSSDAGVGSGTVTVPTDADGAANTAAVPISPQPAAESVAGIRVTVVGP